MDTIAHALWNYLIFMKDKYWRLAVFFSIFPDLPLISFIIYNLFFNGTLNLAFENSFLYILEQGTHSLIISLPLILVLFFIFKKTVLFLFAWPIHIFIDILTHSRDIYPAMPFFPLSDYSFNGINWANIYFVIVNYVLLLIVYYFVFKNARINKNIKKRV